MARTTSIRAARPGEAAVLTEIAMRSKATWGYSRAFMERCRPVLTVSPEYIERNSVFVADTGDGIAGFYSLDPRQGKLELGMLFIAPEHIGMGYGRALLEHARIEAARLGFTTLVIESDPGAEGFYVAAGAKRVGSVASPVEAGRFLPLLELG